MANIPELLQDHVTLEVECLDRLYWNGYIGKLATPGGLVTFMREELGKPIPSPVVLGQVTEKFRESVKAQAEQEQIPIHPFRHKERKDDIANDFRKQRGVRDAVVFIGVAQEKTQAFSGKKVNGQFQFDRDKTVPYFRAPQIYLAFPKRFVPWRKPYDDVSIAGVSDAVFMSSRDGVHWDRRFLEAFVRPGRDRRDWVHRTRMPATGIVPTAEDEISLYISRHYNLPSAWLERMTLRTDGFVSVHAGYRDGEILTKPLVLEGDQIAFNYSTSAVGSLRFEVQDLNGNPLPGLALNDTKALYGDRIAEVVRLRTSGKETGRRLGDLPVRIRFVLKDADLYSFQVVQ